MLNADLVILAILNCLVVADEPGNGNAYSISWRTDGFTQMAAVSPAWILGAFRGVSAGEGPTQ
jgi:hypothetical protein